MGMSLGAVALLLAAAMGQSAPGTGEPRDDRIWTVATGFEAVSIRDVSRSGIPIETSPVAIEADAWLLAVRHEQRRLNRLQAIDASLVRSTTVGLAGPIQRLPAPADEVARVDVRYEYRWMFGRDRLARGLEFSAGPVGVVAWQRLSRSLPPQNALAVSDVEGGGGGNFAIRLARWRRLTLEGGWTAALTIGRTTHALAQSASNAETQGGGGWMLEGRVRASIRLSNRFQLVTSYQRAGQARFASHRSQSDRRNRFEVGVTHVR